MKKTAFFVIGLLILTTLLLSSCTLTGQATRIATDTAPGTVDEPALRTQTPGEEHYIYGIDLEAQYSEDGLSYIHQDVLGSSRAATDETGNKIEDNTYLPYGESLGASSERFSFTGKEAEGELTYFGARYYDADSGRFTQKDPIGDGRNWYAYANNNPMKYVDREGLGVEDPSSQEPQIGQRLYDWAKSQIENSAFVWGGRGNSYYFVDDSQTWHRAAVPGGLKGYDCIGLPVSGLANIYGESLSAFPPNLHLADTLSNEFGWGEPYFVEPSSVSGEDSTMIAVESIPTGSVVFLMHYVGNLRTVQNPEDMENSLTHNDELFTSYENKVFYVGHTLIKGEGTSFVNAIPNNLIYAMPARAQEYNAATKSEFFCGVVRSGNLVPDYDYLLVIPPPNEEQRHE
jgi:RHS repeat-associated protein